MKNTTHYKLKKPDKTDVIRIDDLNYNADVIDGELDKRVLKDELISDYYNKNDIDGKISSEVNRVDAQLAEIVKQTNDNKDGLEGKQDKSTLLNDIGDNYFKQSNYGSPDMLWSSTTLSASHKNKVLTVQGGNVTVPVGGDMPNGTQITFIVGTNIDEFTFVPSSGVSLQSKDNKRTVDGKYASATLIKSQHATWYLIGALK